MDGCRSEQGAGEEHTVRLATIPRASVHQELRVELQTVAEGSTIVSLRLWDTAPNGTSLQPRKDRGFQLRAYELAPVIAALVAALDQFRETERQERKALGRAQRAVRTRGD